MLENQIFSMNLSKVFKSNKWKLKEVEWFLEIFLMKTTSSQQVIETKPFNLSSSKYLSSSNYPLPPPINLISEYKPYQ